MMSIFHLHGIRAWFKPLVRKHTVRGTPLDSFRDVVNLWPSADALAKDLGISVFKARHWKTRDSIHYSYWHSLLKAARKKGIRLSADDLVRIGARSNGKV